MYSSCLLYTSRFVKDGFGTGDCVIIADGTLDIVDYKHGKGVEAVSYTHLDVYKRQTYLYLF